MTRRRRWICWVFKLNPPSRRDGGNTTLRGCLATVYKCQWRREEGARAWQWACTLTRTAHANNRLCSDKEQVIVRNPDWQPDILSLEIETWIMSEGEVQEREWDLEGEMNQLWKDIQIELILGNEGTEMDLLGFENEPLTEEKGWAMQAGASQQCTNASSTGGGRSKGMTMCTCQGLPMLITSATWWSFTTWSSSNAHVPLKLIKRVTSLYGYYLFINLSP